MAAELAALVIEGRKTATASLAEVNRLRPETAPVENGYSVVTDFGDEPQCVIQTTSMTLVPFLDVDADFAAAEGEGDLTLDYWRLVHRDYYTREAAGLGIEFDEDSLVCCERFRLL
jgi:uncharacterized protein YhfF